MSVPSTQHPHILVVSHHADQGAELEQLAARRGYLVRRAETGVQAVEQACDRASGTAPDLIVLDDSLPDIDPLDGYLRWKLDVTRARDGDGLADGTGLYTLPGLALRAQELMLQAFHHAASLACVALAPGAGAVDLVAGVLSAMGRRSDAIGRVGPDEFAVVAPGTDRAGAVLLAERVACAVRAAARDGELPGLRAGYDAVANARYAPIEPKNLMGRATSALRVAKTDGGGPGWIRAF